MAQGFSQKTCLPASRAAMDCWPWASFVEQMKTASSPFVFEKFFVRIPIQIDGQIQIPKDIFSVLLIALINAGDVGVVSFNKALEKGGPHPSSTDKSYSNCFRS